MSAFIQGVLVAAVVAPTFVVFVLHILSRSRDVDAKWQKNKDYRKKRKAGNNLRMFFAPKGGVIKEHVRNKALQLEAVERVMSLLRTLAEGHAFGNPTLYKYHASLKLAKEVAERCKQGVCTFLSQKDVDPQLLSSVDGVEDLLVELMDRRALSGDLVQMLNRFKGQLAVLHAAVGESQVANGSWTYAGDAEKGIIEALLGADQVKKTHNAVPDFPRNPIPELAKQAAKLLKHFAGKGKTSEEPPKPCHLEPMATAEGIHLREGGFLSWAVEFRDRYSIGSNRWLLAMAAILLAAGPVRFLGVVPAMIFFAVVLVELLTEVCRASEQPGFNGFLAKLTTSWHRLLLPLALGAVVILAARSGKLSTPSSVGELQDKGTFLPVPPHYVAGLKDLPARRLGLIPIEGSFPLDTLFGQSGYVPLIYGIMHTVLWILCLLPLPVCYRLQALFVEHFPNRRRLIPQNPVWLHRALGYALVGGLLTAAMIWLVFQGLNCFFSQLSDPQVCDAFDPQAAAGKDVFVLRFHIVWPLMFVFIPLMAFDRYPESSAGATASHASSREVAGTKAKPSAASSSEPSCGSSGRTTEAAVAVTGANPSAASSSEPNCGNSGRTTEATGLLAGDGAPQGGDAEHGKLEGSRKSVWGDLEKGEKLNTWQLLLRFLHHRFIEVCLVAAATAGSVLAFRGSGSSTFVPVFVPFWPMVLLVVVVQIAVKFRAFIVRLVGPTFGCFTARSDEWSDLLKQSWWEIAYTSHVVAFTIMIGFALYIRLQAFWPALFTWTLYLCDRMVGIDAASKNKTPIVIGEERSSYVVNAMDGGQARPSHVRLVVKRPDGFKYKAGQWVHVALHDVGSYCGAPAWLYPMLHWHAFSLASAEHEGELEFHIAVSGNGRPVVEDATAVTASGQSEHFLKVSRHGHWLDWLFPHSVPFFGAKPDRGICGSECRASTSGIHVNLAGLGGSSTKILQPQLQWTGRLWNTVQWMTEMQGSGNHVPEQAVQIMGPYGTLPYTCDAHQAVMLIGAGVGFPSTGAMLRKVLEDNLSRPAGEEKVVCFIWTATKVDQLLLCFPSLLVDLTRYAHKKSLEDLQSWLTIKLFISSFDAGDFLSVDPGQHLFPESKDMTSTLQHVREWLLGTDGDSQDEDGTYIAQGSLGASFGDILRCSRFVKEQVLQKDRSLGICFCGPPDLCSWIRSEQASTILPVNVEFNSECAGG